MGFPTFVNGGAQAQTGPATSLSVPLPASRTANNVLIATINVVGTGKSFSVGGGWTVGDTVNAGAISCCWAWRVIDGTEAAVVFSWSGSTSGLGITTQWTGTPVPTPTGTFAHNNGSGRVLSTSSITTTSDNSTIFNALLSAGNQLINAPTDWPSVERGNSAVGSYLLVSAGVNIGGSPCEIASEFIASAEWATLTFELIGSGVGAPVIPRTSQNVLSVLETYTDPVLTVHTSQVVLSVLRTERPPTPAPPPVGYIIERLDNRVWPTVENAWCVDCGFTLARPTPAANLTVALANGAGILTGITSLVGGQGYSAATIAEVIDANGLGPGTGAVATPIIVSGVITDVSIFPAGANYVYPMLVINDPENTGSGASATITMNNNSAALASASVFSAGDVGSVIRAGYGVMDIVAVTDGQNATVSVRSPVAQIRPDDPISPNQAITQLSGTWTMTAPISQFYLPQLIGFEITGLADGQIIPPVVVPADGIVTLDAPASAIIVGLAFQAQLQSTYLDAGEPTVQGQRKKIAEVTVRVEQSAAFQVGANQPDGSVQSPQQLAPQWQNMVDAPTHALAPFNSPATPLFTGDIRVPIPSGFNTKGQVAVQQLNPLPLQVLDYVPEVLSGDTPSQQAPKRERKGGNEGQQ